jgi:diacylglycerol O-acyltransferase / wax synthase
MAMGGTKMSAQDALWLTMDRPNNLMVVDVAVVLDGIPSTDDVRAGFANLVARHPVFGRRARHHGTTWLWIDDPDFDLDRHVSVVDPGEDADMAAVQRFVAVERARPLDRERPLWAVTLLAPVTLSNGGVGSVVLARFHHAIADGVRLTQVMLGMLDPESVGAVPTVVRQGVSGSLVLSTDTVRAGASEVVRVATTTTKAVASTLGRTVTDPMGGISGAASVLSSGLTAFRHPDRLVDAFEVLGGEDHRTLNDATSASKLAVGSSQRTVWTGHPGAVKAVAWSEAIPLDGVKRVARSQGATVNDVLVAALAGALKSYLTGRGDDVDEVLWMVPVNLKPFDQELPADLGNYFALVMLDMPLNGATPADRIQELRHRMLRIKNSDEPVMTFGLQRTISLSPSRIATALTNFFANKAVGVLTNVPGPRSALWFAGIPVRQVIGFAPCSGDQPMTATIFTYNDTLTVGFASDAGLVPDPGTLVDLVGAELREMIRELG